MLGCVCCGPKVRGALGFSKEKSLVYGARTENFGPACGVSAPLPFCSAIVKSSSNAVFDRWATHTWAGSPSMAALSKQARAAANHRDALTRLNNAWLA